MDRRSAILALENGQIYYGESIGVPGIRVGEIVFNTAMMGYQEIMTDPSYAKQIITFTYPHVGNTGINTQDCQNAQIFAAGFVIKSVSHYMSNWRATISLTDYLQQQKTVAISGIDTRDLTKKIRQHGILRACLMTGTINKDYAIQQAQEFSGLDYIDLISKVTTKKIYTLNNHERLHIVLIDYGVKNNIIRCLSTLGCKITVVPAHTDPQKIFALQPHGLLLSNGPGNPQAYISVVKNIRILLKFKIPVFGICLGHQLLALALGSKIYKMTMGHHGANHPVQQVTDKKVLITSQNHGYAVAEDSLGDELQVTHRSLFDQSLQGFKHRTLPIVGFQGHPEGAPGPSDARSLFSDFIHTVREYRAETNRST